MMDHEALFNAHLEGTLTPEQERELATLLEDEVVGREFVEYVYETTQMIDVARKLVQRPARIKRFEPNRPRYGWVWGVVAASILLAIVLGVAYKVAKSNRSEIVKDDTSPPKKSHPRYTRLKLHVVDADDAKLSTGRRIRKRDELLLDTFALRSGKAEVRLSNGVTLAFKDEGKVSFYSTDVVRFREGRLIVHVPTEAVGFTVKTDDGDVVDLGTKFTLQKTPRGNRLVVRKGRVRVHSAVDPKVSATVRVSDVVEMSKEHGTVRIYPEPGRIDPRTGEFGKDGFVTLVPWGAVWQYNDGEKLPDPAWNDLSYDDSRWGKGKAKIGFGDPDVVTVIPSGSRPSNDRLITAWFRHGFDVPAGLKCKDLRLVMKVDDGAVVYLNGKEIHRYNMPRGRITPVTPTLGTVSERDQPVPSIMAPVSLLRTGKNVLAVEVHQRGHKTSDLWLDVCCFARIDNE